MIPTLLQSIFCHFVFLAFIKNSKKCKAKNVISEVKWRSKTRKLLFKWVQFMKYMFLFFVILFSDLTATTVIIGGGPAGLGAAIACRLQGEEVIVIEKRAEYTRDQFLFLIPESIEQLKIWDVQLPQMQKAEVRPGICIGFLSIQHLERELCQRALALGVVIRQETFSFLDPMRKSVFLENSSEALPYDLLIAADGLHSQVRQSLNIPFIEIGRASAIAALFSMKETNDVDISQPIQKGSFFARRIAGPGFSLVLMQNFKKFSLEEMSDIVYQCDWLEESLLLKKRQGSISDPIPVILARAKQFFDLPTNAVLIGDAAAVASFFQGRGANTAIETAGIVGRYLFSLKKGQFIDFEKAMEQATDNLIDHSRFLFE